MTSLSWVWVPNISIGDFYFDKEIDVDGLSFSCTNVKPADKEQPWVTYEIDGDNSRFSVENGILLSVECVSNFFYKDINLIGMNTNDAIELLDSTYSVVDSWDNGKEIVFNNFGLILWDEDHKVDSITVSS